MAFIWAATSGLLALASWQLLRRRVQLRPLSLVLLVLAGAVAGSSSVMVQRWFWAMTSIDLTSSELTTSTSLAAYMAFVAPLQEGAKLLVLWPFFTSERLRNASTAIVAAALCTAGFSALDVWTLHGTAADHVLLRGILLQVGRFFFTICWAAVLGTQLRYSWLRVTWIVSVVLHGLFLHLLATPGVAIVVGLVPVLLAMLGVFWAGVRRLGVEPTSHVARFDDTGSPSEELLAALLRNDERRVLVHWVLLGLFVTLGVVMAALAVAVYLGHRLGIDFAMADQRDLAANGPLSLLGAAILAAFPVSAYLVARASGTRSVIEPALGAASALLAVVGLLSLTAPAAVAFALAVAPVAFALACVGAWFGLSRD